MAASSPGRPAARERGGSLAGTFVRVALLVALPFLALVGVLAWVELTAVGTSERSEALARVTQIAAGLDRGLSARLEGLEAMAAALATGASPSVADGQARRLRQRFPDLERVTFVDDLGMVVASVPAGEVPRGGLADQGWFKRAGTSTEPFVMGARASAADVVVGLYAPARTAEGQLRGVVAADLVLRTLQDEMGKAVRPPGAVEVVDAEGRVVARQPPLFLLKEAADASGLGALVRAGGGAGELTFADGVRRLAGVATIRSAGWVAVAGVPATAIGTQTRLRVMLTLGAAGLVAVLAVVGAVAQGRRQARAMERLRGGMRRLASGDVPPALPVTAGGEVGQLTHAFNQMLTWLHNRVRELEVLSQVTEEAGAAAVTSASAQGVLPGLLRRVANGMRADAAVVMMREGSDLVARAAVGLSGVQVDGVQLRRGQGLGWAVLAERGPVMVGEMDGDYRVEEPYLREADLRAVVGCPMGTGDEPAGVVVVGYRQPQTLGEAELNRLSTMVRRMASAVEHARAFEAVRQSTAGLEAQVAEQMEALQRAAAEQAEVRRQAQEASRKAQEASRKAQELEQAMRIQAERPPEIREVIVEKEVVRERARGTGGDDGRFREELQKTVSEELRAPLSALLDLPRFLVEGLNQPLVQEERQQLEVLRDRGEEILELIDSLVVLTGLEAGQVTVAKAPFDLPGLIQRVVRMLQPRAAARGNRIEVDIKLHVGQILSDSRRVEQILTGLVGNAIRYTEVGEIRITCYLRDADVVLVIADDGVGFAPEEVDQIFRPFLPVGPRDGRRLPGTGLSLTVCERLVAALGGRIKVESEVDRGTWVTVTLPGAAG